MNGDGVQASVAAHPSGLRFSAADVNRAADAWGFNCGPGALCAALNLTPDELRPKLGEFEQKGYTNPTLMLETLDRCGVRWRSIYRSDDPLGRICPPNNSISLWRIQWGGRWTRPGVPMRARYRKTHWVAVKVGKVGLFVSVFDVNAPPEWRVSPEWRDGAAYGGWISYKAWAHSLVPGLMRACVPDGDGTWWPTHGVEVLR